MSDNEHFYDSLEDSDTSVSTKTKTPVDVRNDVKNRQTDAFRLHEPFDTERHRYMLFPWIKLEQVRTNQGSEVGEVEEYVTRPQGELLTKKGLQKNIDGSFTTSPRRDNSDPPFVAREYNKISPQLLCYKNKLRNYKKNEEAKCENLTDSMKQRMLEESKTDGVRKKNIVQPCLLPSKLNLKLLPVMKRTNRSPEITGIVLKQSPKQMSLTVNHNKIRPSSSLVVLPEINKRKTNSYLEQYQKKKGYNPDKLKQVNKELSVTSRSVCGESHSDLLTDVSSTWNGTESTDGTESFYRQVMAEESGRKVNQLSSYVSSSLDTLLETKVMVTCKKRIYNSDIKLPKINLSLNKRNSALTPAETPRIDKGMLSQRAKQYGDLASSRNILRLSQIRKKSAATDYNLKTDRSLPSTDSDYFFKPRKSRPLDGHFHNKVNPITGQDLPQMKKKESRENVTEKNDFDSFHKQMDKITFHNRPLVQQSSADREIEKYIENKSKILQMLEQRHKEDVKMVEDMKKSFQSIHAE